MTNFLIHKAIGACVRCNNNQFSGPATLRPGTTVRCANCGYVGTIGEDHRLGGLKPGEAMALALRNLPDAAHVPFVTLMEQKYRQAGDFQMLREIRAYKMGKFSD